ncbi:IS5/IS1182 family transposase, partial [Enterococcus faecium]
LEIIEPKIGLTFACLNMKKLVKIKKIRARKECFSKEKQSYFSFILEIIHIKKTNLIFT